MSLNGNFMMCSISNQGNQKMFTEKHSIKQQKQVNISNNKK